MSNFAKIKAAGFTILNLINNLKNLEEQEMGELKLTTALFMIEDDTNLINTYRLNYTCFIKSFNREQAKKEFVHLALQIYPE
jgi:hypothetical protein